MYALGSQTHNLPIISLQTGQTVSTLDRPVINPDNLEIPAFFVAGGRRKNTVLMARDIRRMGPDGILINAFEDIEEAAEIVRLKTIIDRRFNLVGLPVVSEGGSKLGKVEDYTINVENFMVQKLYVKQSMLKNMLMNNLVIDRTQITDITPKQIVVRDTGVKEPLLSPAATPVVPD